MSVVAYAAAALAAVGFLLTASCHLWRAYVLRTLQPCNRPESLGLIGAGWAFTCEWAAITLALLLLPAGWIRSRTPATGDSRGAVILIHDWGVNTGPFWLLRRRLLRHGWHPVVALPHRAAENDAEHIADSVHALVERLAQTRPPQIVLLAHGYGGLVARLYACRHGCEHVRRIVTLGTPHRGSLLPALLGRRARTVAPQGPLLTRLQRDHVPRELDVIALHSTFDATVLPPANAEYPRAFNIRLNNVGHYGLLFSSKVFTLVGENLAVPIGGNAKS